MQARGGLGSVRLLSPLPPGDLAEIERRCRWRRYLAKEQIFDRESDGADVYFVVEGCVQIVNFSPSGREIAFAEVKHGAFFGELTALDGKSRSASAVAVIDTTLASLTAPTFKELLLKRPDIAFVVLLHLAGIVRSADSRIMDLSTLSAINRVQAEILRMAEPRADDANVGIVRRLPSHNDIASRVGTTRETVSRVLSHLSRIRVAKREGHGLVVFDRHRLGAMIDPEAM